MTKQQIYNAIVSLTAEIKTTDVGLKLFEAARLDGQRVKEVSYRFTTEYPELYQKMCDFATEFNKLVEESKTGNDAEIFGLKRDEENEIFVFDPNVINSSSYFAFTFLTGIDDSYLFTNEYFEGDNGEYVTDFSAYLEDIEKESGSPNLANFLGNASFTEEELECLEDCGFEYSNIYDLLTDVFAGNLKEYVG